MNATRTILVLAAALLLATAGLAEAQSVSFSATSGTVKEGVAANAAGAFQVKVTRSPATLSGITFTTTPTLTSVGAEVRIGPGGTPITNGAIAFPAGRTEVTLVITQSAENTRSPALQGWLDETLTLALRAPAGTRISPDLVLTLDDAQGQPTAAFTKTSMRLTENTLQTTRAKITVPVTTPPLVLSSFTLAGTGTTAAALLSSGLHRLRMRTEPANAIGTVLPNGSCCAFDTDELEFKVAQIVPGDGVTNTIPVAGMAGVWSLPVTVAQAAGTSPEIRIGARRDTTGFKNVTYRLALMDLDVKTGTGASEVTHGAVKGGPPLVIEVISDEPVPTVSFSPTDISIKEGGSTTAVIVAAGALGEEVGMVDIAPDGDALVDLYRGGTKLEPKDGVIRVDMKDTNVVRLTARSTSDRSLLDGQMKQKTWRMVDADGANINPEANTWTVTVEGSTAVPALPLVAQLLLALLLTAGGARLYRRRGRGGLLALLAAAALLGPAAGTAEAQGGTVSFSQTTGTVVEGAAADKRFQVTVTSTGNVGQVQLIANPPFSGTIANNSVSNGIITVDAAGMTGTVPVANLALPRNQVVLTIYQDNETTANWLGGKHTFALRAAAGAKIGPDLVVTLEDDDAQPTAIFADSNGRPYQPNPQTITEGSINESVVAAIVFPAGTPGDKTPDLTTGFNDIDPAGGDDRLRIKVEPPNGIGTWTGSALRPGPLRMLFWGSKPCNNGPIGTAMNGCIIPITGMAGAYSVPTTIQEARATNNSDRRFIFEARPDEMGFKNTRVTFSFLPKAVSAGIVAAGPPLVVEILSDEPVPTVSFSPTDISIKEGGSTTMALISEGPTGSEVNTVKLRAEGNAVVGLFRDDKIVAPLDGVVTVSLKDTNVARLTVRSKSDPSLLDGQMKMASWTIIDAEGAKIDADAGTFTVTVEGSTAVPALPLVAQLLLALFLTAGGARLYRGRRK